MAQKTLIDSTGYEIKSGRTLIGGTGYDIKKGRTLIDGTGYDISFGASVGELAVGSSVFMNVTSLDGLQDTRTEFLIVHQGNPSTQNYSNADGTWVYMKDAYFRVCYSWADSLPVDYAASSVDYLLNTYSKSFYNLLSADVREAILKPRIPYKKYTATNTSILSTFEARIFLPSPTELGYTAGTYNSEYDGVVLEYFSDGSSSIRKCRFEYWTRRVSNYSNAYTIDLNGNLTTAPVAEYDTLYADDRYIYIRPMFILNKELVKYDENFNVYS
jgi:hypothetical protein